MFSDNQQPKTVTFLLGCWFLYIIAKPFYFYASGLPQPADILLLPAIALTSILYLKQPTAQVTRPFVVLILFAVLTLLINLTYFFLYGGQTFLLSGVFTIYNALVFGLGVFIFMQNHQRATTVTLTALMIVLSAELMATVLLDPAQSGRAMGSFNNPNQLAYWGLLTLLCVLTLRHDKPVNIIDYAAFGASGFVILLSLSKAGIVAYLMAGLIVTLSKRVGTRLRIFVILSFTMLVCLSFVPGMTDKIPVISDAIDRVQNIGTDTDDSFEGRGYTRLSIYPEYLIFGAGEGGYDRFSASGFNLEIHSGFASALFCYGALGFGLFITFLITGLKGAKAHIYWLLTPVLFYSLTHQTFRFTGFWILMSLMYSVARNHSAEKTHD